MEKYFIKYGLGGGFGGARNCVVEECKDEKQANEMAFELACEEYDSYDGLHGLRDVMMIMEEEEVKEDEAVEIWEEERESWIDYYVEVYDPLKHDEIIEMYS